MRVIVRMWTVKGYHKDVALLDERQVRMTCGDMECSGTHLMAGPSNGVRVLVDPKQFPEAAEFEVIVQP